MDVAVFGQYLMLHMKLRVNMLLLVALSATTLGADTTVGRYLTEVADIRLVEVVTDLSRPWAVSFLPDGDLLITERTGALKRISGDRVSLVTGMPKVASVGQGGLLDVALHADYSNNGIVYFSYTHRFRFGYGTRIGFGRLRGNSIEDFEVIFSMEEPTGITHHFGSRLAFANDGTLFFSIGDRGDRTRAQDLGDHAGKVLRINDDGTVPENNPFIGRYGTQPEIFSYGHRNAQGLLIDPTTQLVWAHEHGPQGGDEVNIIRAGVNYGWPLITYGREYSGDYIAPAEYGGLEQPIIHWTPSIAPSGLSLYTGNRIPGWKGNMFAGALAGRHLRRMEVEGSTIVHQEVLLEGEVGRIRDVRQGPDGYLWILTDAPSGSLFRIEPDG